MEKLGGFERKRLSDISNLQGRPKPMNLDLKKKLTTTITPKEYIDKLQKVYFKAQVFFPILGIGLTWVPGFSGE